MTVEMVKAPGNLPGNFDMGELVLPHRDKIGFISQDVGRLRAVQAQHDESIALEDLRLEELFVVYPGGEEYALGERARAIGLAALLERLRRIAQKNGDGPHFR